MLVTQRIHTVGCMTRLARLEDKRTRRLWAVLLGGKMLGVVAYGLFKAVDLTGTLRVERDGELEGLDIFEHGSPAYRMEFGQGMSYSSPHFDPVCRPV